MRFALALALACLSAGCAVHAPMSEALVLSRSLPGAETALVGGDRVLGMQYVQRGALADTTRAYNPRGRGLGVFGLNVRSDDAASVTLGAGVVGVDATRHVAGPVFILASGSVLGGAEAFVLGAVPSPSRRLGLSVGAGGRCRYDLRDDPEDDSEFVLALRARGAWACSAGGRATALVLIPQDPSRFERLVLLGTTYVGMSPVDGGLVGGFGLAVGGF